MSVRPACTEPGVARAKGANSMTRRPTRIFVLEDMLPRKDIVAWLAEAVRSGAALGPQSKAFAVNSGSLEIYMVVDANGLRQARQILKEEMDASDDFDYSPRERQEILNGLEEVP